MTEPTPEVVPEVAPEAVPEVTPEVVVPEVASAPSADPVTGGIVFFDAPVFGESAATYAGLVLAVAGGRARVHTLGLARDVADFPVGDLRLSP